MGKKEFEEKYIKDNRTEDEKMLDIIHENSRKRQVVVKKKKIDKFKVMVTIYLLVLTICFLAR